MTAKRKAKVKASTKKAAGKPIVVKIDPALKKAWSAALSALHAADREGNIAFDRKYEAVGEIVEHDPPLYLAGGVATVGDFVANYLPNEGVRNVLRNVRVAKYASPDEEEKYGTSKIDAVLDYLEAKNGKPANGRIPVDFAKLRIPAGDGSIAFADATVQQLRDAQKKLDKHGATKAKLSPVVSEIAKCVPKSAKEITVRYADGHVTLGRIPVRIFGEVLRALAKAHVPTS